MAILSITESSTGLSGVSPSIVYINTNNTLSEVLAPGYLNSAKSLGVSFSPTQSVLVYTTDHGDELLNVSISGGSTSLVPQSSGGGGVPATLTFITKIDETPFAPNSFALSSLPTGFLTSTAITGTPNTVTLTGSANITVTHGSGNGNPVFDLTTIGGLTPNTYSNATVTVDAHGRVTAISAGTAGINSITGSANISVTAGPNPTLNLTNTAVAPGGAFTNASITVDRFGRITTAANGTAPVTLITGTPNQIDVFGTTTPTLSLSSSVVFPGTVTLHADPVTALQAATKQYVDAISAGLNIHASCYAGATANLSATYNNGTAGVGATLTNAGAFAAFALDGTTPALNDRILIKDQTLAYENGIYTVTTVGDNVSVNWVLTRATDYDTPGQVHAGDFTIVVNGTVNAGTAWIETSNVTTIGTDPIVFTQLTVTSTGVTSVTGGTNITVTGAPQTPIVNLSATYAGQSTITTVGALSSGSLASGFTIVSPQVGGTGVNNGSDTITLGGNIVTGGTIVTNGNVSLAGSLTTSGAFATTFTMTGPTSVQFPTSGLLATSTTLGTVTTGVWQATVIDGLYGGTGVANTGKTITLSGNIVTGGNLTTSGDISYLGSFTGAFTLTGNTAVQFPTSGLLATSTTLGTVTTGVWNATPITVPFGGTGNTTFTAYSVICAGTTSTGTFQNVVGVGTAGQVLTSAGAGLLPTWATPSAGTVSSVSGDGATINVANGTTTPVVSIISTYPGQASISTLGVVTVGTWQSDKITGTYGGTGVNNGSKLITVGGNFTTTPANDLTLTTQGATNVTLPTTGTLATVGGTVASVTSANAAHITIGGTANNPTVDIYASYVGQSSITTVGALASGSLAAGFTPVTVPLGGTGNTTFTAYSLICAGTTSTGTFQNVVGVGTSGQLLVSAGAGALPAWTSASTANLAVTNATNSFGFNEQYQMKVQDYSEAVSALGSISGATSMNLQNGNVFSATVTAATTFSITNVPASGTCASLSLVLTNGGAGAVTWMTGTKWPGGSAPTLTASGVDVLAFFTVDGGTTWYGMLAGSAFA